MSSAPYLDTIKIRLLHAATCCVGSEWNYSNIISPFTRIYLIKSGYAHIYLNETKVLLEPGYLYIIPSYTFCSYSCPESMCQTYINFTNEIARGLNIFDIYKYTIKVKASSLDEVLFDRLIEINPQIPLPHTDPYIYQKKLWGNKDDRCINKKGLLESQGIILQLLSRHIDTDELNTDELLNYGRFKKIFTYINCHLNNDIQLSKLADIACYSEDHFSRIFRKTTGLLPLDYINKKRIEKSQLMMMTSSKNLNEIFAECGFNSLSYFYRTFKKHTGITPSNYRKLHGQI